MLNSTIPREQENLKSVKETFQDLLFFAKNPNRIEKVSLPVKQHLRSVFVLFIIKFLITIVWTILATPVISIFHSSSESVIATDSSVLGLLVFSVILGPLIEETIYRLPLVFKPIYLGLGVGLATYVITSYYILQISIWNLEHLIGYRLIACVTMMTLTYWGAMKVPNLDTRVKTRIFPFLFYFSAVAFGLAHFEGLNDYNFIYFSVMFIPYLISGIIFGVVRIMNGFVYALILHSFNNLIVVVLPILIGNLAEIMVWY